MTDEMVKASTLTERLGAQAKRYVWSGKDYRSGSWSDTEPPLPGDVVSMGTLAMDGPVDNRYRITADDVTYVAVPYTLWGDYCGDTVSRSNHRSILRDYPEYVVEVIGDYGSHSLAMREDSDVPAFFVDELIGLVDTYPLYDDDDHSQLESDLEGEDWESWGRDDVIRAAESTLDEIAEDDPRVIASAVHPDLADEVMSEFRNAGTVTYETETAVGGFWHGPWIDGRQSDALAVMGAEVARRIAERDVTAWDEYAHSLSCPEGPALF